MVRPTTLGSAHELVIDKARFDQLSAASTRDWQYLGLEEKYDVLYANFEELEQQQLTLALSHSLHLDHDWASMSDARLQLTRRIVNCLTAARLYKDQVNGDLTRLQRAGAIPPLELNGLWDQESARSFGFRLVEALRNHFQHSSLPLDRIAFPTRNVGTADSPTFSFGVELSLDPAPILADRQIASNLKREVTELGKHQNDVLLFMRQYVEGLSRIHTKVREVVEADAAVCQALLESARTEWSTVGGSPPPGLAAIAQADDGQWTELAVLNLNASGRRQALVRRNRSAKHLSRRFVTSARDPSLHGPIDRDV